MLFNQLIINQTNSVDHCFSEKDFELSFWHSQKNSVELTGGRGASLKIIIDGQFYVLRQYLRGGLIARLLKDQYFWTGLTRTRPYLELKAVQHAVEKKLPVPEVVAYQVYQQGVFYKASIISRYIDNEGTLASFLYENVLQDNQWFELGKLIRTLHQANLFHADLNANNILLDETGKFYIIDFDKAQIMRSMTTQGEKNIQRLLRSLQKIQTLRLQQNLPFHFDMMQWNHLLEGYK